MTDYCFGFTGTRHGTTLAQAASLHRFLIGGTGEFHHGDCFGSDSEAHDIATALGYAIVGHPPTSYALRAFRNCSVLLPEKPYIERNKDIVDATTALIATPYEAEEQPRGGTWSTVRYARKQGKPTVIIFPDGSIKQSDNRRAPAALPQDEQTP